MRIFRKVFLCYIFFALAIHTTCFAAWSPEEAISVKKINAVTVSPDDSKVAYFVQSANLTLGVWESKIVVEDLAKNTTIFSIEDLKEVDQLMWAKDSESIWFLAKGDKVRALWKRSMNHQTAEKIFEPKENIQTFLVSPDGTKIAYLSSMPFNEKYLPARAYQIFRPNGLWIYKLNSSEEPALITKEEM